MFNAPKAIIDSTKTFVCGHSLGGWTSLLSTFGDQNVFKASLSFDPAFSCHMEETIKQEFECKWPVCVIMSSQFLPVNLTHLFGFGQYTSELGYQNLLTMICEKNPNFRSNVEFLTIDNSSHIDQGDLCMYS